MNEFQLIILIIISVMFGPPLLLFIAGMYIRKSYPKKAKINFIIAAVYLIVGLGICGSALLG